MGGVEKIGQSSLRENNFPYFIYVVAIISIQIVRVFFVSL